MISAEIFRPIVFAWVVVVGAAIGSFLNVVIYRVPRGFLVALPSRSACRECKRKLAWFENIPVLSYLFLRAKCKVCGSAISARYPLVEVMTATLFLAVYEHKGLGLEAIYYWVFCSALVAITFIDLDFRIIPDVISLPLLVLGIAMSPFIPSLGLKSSIIGAAAGGFGLWAMAWAYQKVTGREGMGFGDVKLLAMIGAFLGPQGALGSVLVSSIVGSIVGIVIIVIQRKNLKLALPYGPFLAVGALVCLFWGDELAIRLYPHLLYE